jgi:dihydropteroate synthase
MENAKIQMSGISPTLCLRGNLLTFENALVMGIINVNDDSFYAASRAKHTDQILQLAGQHIQDGAAFIDVGISSSRPGAILAEPEYEIERLKPVIKALRETFPEVLISVDTIYANVAQKAMEWGADMINDISGGQIDREMLPLAARENWPYIMMHMRGTPATMQTLTQYNDLVPEIISELAERVQMLRRAGHTNLVMDPGFGFSKTLEQNYQLLQELEAFQIFRAPVMAGVSRKSMVTRLLNVSANEALNGTTALHILLLQKGVDILRVHDVKAAQEAIRIHTFAKESKV